VRAGRFKIDQATLAEFISSGNFYSHIRRCRKSYASKLESFLSAVREHRLELTFPFGDGGMNQTGYFADPDTPDDVCSAKLAAAGFDIPSVRRFSIRATRPGLVFGFTAFDHETIRSSIAGVAKLLR
jgi:GntR family transcriptional regulator / MocR family aminotransferase